ncbi:cobalt-precorrin-6A reductase [Pseudomonas sp. RIT-PI-S]|uniref:cobalt-precorrin-6A reductase n=1 Tax=Pseudomonas sp. RIT-PI-S TaxID=3035295 RepID=UPI0021DB244B|nr:cobalt-precorrin-6A reductase [Pseudomonas sp. RIT-PI-S]
MRRILLLGGVTESLRLARQLGPADVYSLAGIGRVPTDLHCAVKVGGYGGPEGLAAYLQAESISLLVDATHPYAARMSHNAAAAARRAGVPCWALRRPGWQPQAGDDWHEVAGWDALSLALQPFRRPFFTLGREPLAHLDNIPAYQHWTLRCLDPYPGNARCEVIGARGPFQLEQERALFAQGNFDVLVSKNSGSDATEPKLQVARERRLPVLMLARPQLPPVDREFHRLEALACALAAFEN